ncbi:MAG TPA: conjugal transfer protein TraL [Burkholderiaceae bacterium]|nr:conjugal transfer protein TraL [Burkholderiaceae bacterium]
MLQGKGGVGKSLLSSFLAQYLMDRGVRPVACVDTDPVNQSLSSYRALRAVHLPLMDGSRIDERRFDALMERLLSEDGTFVVDNGAASFVPLSNYLIEARALELLAESGRDVFVHTVITGGQALTDTLVGFKALAEQTRSRNIIVWLNEYFGAIEAQGKAFPEMRVFVENREKVRGVVRIARRNQDTFGRDVEEMAAAKLTFREVIEGGKASLMTRHRLRTVQREIYEQLDAVLETERTAT